MQLSEIDGRIENSVEDMVALQAELTARPAIGPENGGTGEWDKSNCLEEYLAQRGLGGAQHCDAPDSRVPEGTRPNFAVLVPGAKDFPRVWVMSHLDVVPPGEQLEDGTWRGWNSDPFKVERKGDAVFGRGVADNQHAIVSSVFAAKALVDLGVQPPHTVALLMVSDEETGNSHGLTYVLKERPEWFSPDDVIIVPDGGNEDGTMIEIAEKSVLFVRFRVRGKQSHGSMPQLGLNAFRAASELVCRLDEGFHQRFDGNDPLYVPPRSTFEPTLHAANVPNVNTIPGEDLFAFDCRILPDYDVDEVLDYAREECLRLDTECGTKTEIEIQFKLTAPAPTPPDAQAAELLKPAIKDVYGVEAKPMGVGGGTVAAVFRARGVPAVVWSKTDWTAHQANESCAIANMVGDARVFARVFLQDF